MKLHDSFLLFRHPLFDHDQLILLAAELGICKIDLSLVGIAVSEDGGEPFSKMIVGKGMFHCYPVFPIVPEAKEGWRQMVELMKA